MAQKHIIVFQAKEITSKTKAIFISKKEGKRWNNFLRGSFRGQYGNKPMKISVILHHFTFYLRSFSDLRLHANWDDLVSKRTKLLLYDKFRFNVPINQTWHGKSLSKIWTICKIIFVTGKAAYLKYFCHNFCFTWRLIIFNIHKACQWYLFDASKRTSWYWIKLN